MIIKLLIYAYILNFSILQILKLPKKPLLLVFETESQIDDLFKVFKSHLHFISGYDKVEQLTQLFLNESSSAVVLLLDCGCKGKNVQENINFLLSVARTGKVADITDGIRNYLQVAPIIACTKETLGGLNLRENVFEIHLPNVKDCHQYDLLDLVPDNNKISVIKDYFERFCREDKNKIAAAIVATLVPFIMESGDISDIEKFFKIADKYILKDEEYKEEYTDVVETAKDLLLRDFLKNDNIYKLPHISKPAKDKIETAVFFKGSYVYISEKLLKVVTTPLLTFIPINRLKEELLKDGFLVGHSSDYTQKMSFYVDKEYYRTRMLKFNINGIRDYHVGTLLSETLENKCLNKYTY